MHDMGLLSIRQRKGPKLLPAKLNVRAVLKVLEDVVTCSQSSFLYYAFVKLSANE